MIFRVRLIKACGVNESFDFLVFCMCNSQKKIVGGAFSVDQNYELAIATRKAGAAYAGLASLSQGA